MAFGDEYDVRAANILLAAVRDLAIVGNLSGRNQYAFARIGRSGGGHEAELTTLGEIEAALMGVLARVVDGHAERAVELRTYLATKAEYLVEGPLMLLCRSWFPAECWNARCVATHCAGIHHVDATGAAWEQREGFAYNPKTDKYDLPENEAVGSVVSVDRRDAVASELKHRD